jgi:pimeloyl-ACP methyl ester carboxylesterase
VSSSNRRRRSLLAAVSGAAVLLLGAGTFVTVSTREAHAAGRPTTADHATTTMPATTTTAVTPPTAPAVATPVIEGVGVTHVTFVDSSRPTSARGTRPATSSRALATTIWYPSSTNGATDAPVAAGTYPLVVFAHGFDVDAATYDVLLSNLAQRGYVVAAPEFPMTSSDYSGAADEGDVINQAGDMSFVISAMTSIYSVPRTVAGHVDASHIAVMGHSDGGVTAAAVAFNSTARDGRVTAAVILSGAMIDYPGSWFTGDVPPMLAVHGTADPINPFASSQQLFDTDPGPRALVAVSGAGHLPMLTTQPYETAVVAVVADYLVDVMHPTLDSGLILATAANAAGLTYAAS